MINEKGTLHKIRLYYGFIFLNFSAVCVCIHFYRCIFLVWQLHLLLNRKNNKSGISNK